jgi:hypothetical protein
MSHSLADIAKMRFRRVKWLLGCQRLVVLLDSTAHTAMLLLSQMKGSYLRYGSCSNPMAVVTWKLPCCACILFNQVLVLVALKAVTLQARQQQYLWS